MNVSENAVELTGKFLPTCLFGIAALLGGVSPAWAQQSVGSASPQVSLGSASDFSVLGATNVTCTGGTVTGNLGVYPGSYTDTGCMVSGGSPPATSAAAVLAQTDLLRAYSALQSRPCTQTIAAAAFTGNVPELGPLAPGVYCFPAAATFTSTTLILDGPANGIWIFKVGAALTGTNFSVVMAGGGQPRNVFWSVDAGATMTTSAFTGNILAGNTTGGSITLTGGSVTGRALAKVAVTITGTSVGL